MALLDAKMCIRDSLKGLEPLTVRLEGACSIQLSYRDIVFYHVLNAQS